VPTSQAASATPAGRTFDLMELEDQLDLNRVDESRFSALPQPRIRGRPASAGGWLTGLYDAFDDVRELWPLAHEYVKVSPLAL
jgi:hypothetical protein